MPSSAVCKKALLHVLLNELVVILCACKHLCPEQMRGTPPHTDRKFLVTPSPKTAQPENFTWLE